MSVNTRIKRLRRAAFCSLLLSFLLLPFRITEASLISPLPAAEKEYASIAEEDFQTVLQEASADTAAEQILKSLSLDEKLCQLFILSPEDVTGTGTVTTAGDGMREAIFESPVGGFIYMEPNLESREQITEMLERTQEYSLERTGLPMFFAVDEEGGSVLRISGRGIIDGEQIPSMREIGESGDNAWAYETGLQIGEYLLELGFNVDFAPVADVLTNPDNYVVRDRSFGSDPHLVSDMVVSLMSGLETYGIIPTMKHFPGHGSTGEDSHEGYAVCYRSAEELMECDLIPFISGIQRGAQMIMAGHISLPNVTGDMLPASLNRYVITDLLREQLGFDGIVITDALNMGAVTEHYDSSEAAVMSLQAGCDLLLMPADWNAAKRGIEEALENGTLTNERIDESVLRIIKVKLMMNRYNTW